MDPMTNKGEAMPSADSSSMSKGTAQDMGDENQGLISLKLPKEVLDTLRRAAMDFVKSIDKALNPNTEQEDMPDMTGEPEMTESQKLSQEIAQMSSNGRM